jgi:hypothetical protein
MRHDLLKKVLLEVGGIVVCLIILLTGSVIGLAVMDVSLAQNDKVLTFEKFQPYFTADVVTGAQVTGAQTVTQNVNTVGGIVPCSEPYSPDNPESCGLAKFIQLIQNVINALFLISIPLATIAFVYIGWTLLTAQGSVAKINDAKHIAKNVIWGFVIILSAWLIVYTITYALLDPSFNSFLTL